MKDLENVNFDLELIEIKNMTEEGFKKLCKEKVKVKTFEYLISKQIRRKPNHLIKYERFEMAKYLQEKHLGYSVKEKQNLFQCRTNDTDVKTNKSWKYDNLTCRSCKETNIIETQEHILVCKNLLNNNSRVTYIPTYIDLYSEDIDEQMYTSMILCGNLRLVPL